MTKETQKIGLRVVDQIVLENLKIACSSFLGPHALSMMGIESYADELTQQFAHHLRTYVLSEKTKEEQVTNRFRYPATWWEHLKYEHAPAWFLKRWPVRWKHENKSTTVRHYQCIPMFSKVLDPHEQKHTFMSMAMESARQESLPDR